MANLNPKQQRFVAEYLVDLNATQAAIRAGYSQRTAKQQGARLLTHVDVQAAVQARIARRIERTDVTADRVLIELARIAFGDARKVMTWGPDGVKLIDSATLSEDAAMTVAEASETATANGRSLKLKLHDKVAALRMLSQHLGLLIDTVDLKNTDGSLVSAWAAAVAKAGNSGRGGQ